MNLRMVDGGGEVCAQSPHLSRMTTNQRPDRSTGAPRARRALHGARLDILAHAETSGGHDDLPAATAGSGRRIRGSRCGPRDHRVGTIGSVVEPIATWTIVTHDRAYPARQQLAVGVEQGLLVPSRATTRPSTSLPPRSQGACLATNHSPNDAACVIPAVRGQGSSHWPRPGGWAAGEHEEVTSSYGIGLVQTFGVPCWCSAEVEGWCPPSRRCR